MSKTIDQILRFSPNASREDWHRHENGGGWIYKTATVPASAFIGGDAQVYGNARVSGNAWVYSPLYIQGSRDALTVCSWTEIAVGCQVHPITHWLEHYQAIGRACGYSAEQVEEYGEYLQVAARFAARLRK